MVAPSLPWVSINFGGSPFRKELCTKLTSGSAVQFQRLVECSSSQLGPIFDSLNQLGAISFKINKPVLDIIIQLFNSGQYPELELPVHPNFSKSKKEVPVPESFFGDDKAYSLLKTVNDFSEWCFMLQRLSLANHLRDEIFWYPYNMDFRSRVYSLSTFLTHYDSDEIRSLFLFGCGKKLGKDGFNWLKVHIVNLSDTMSSRPFAERLEHFETLKDDVLDSADNPLDGRRWWMKSDDPWQMLGACFEYSAAIRSEDPTEFISHLPISQDGSCNGLQHYAALSRDKKSAEMVNLTPSVYKQDVYNEVAKAVEEKRKRDVHSADKKERNIAIKLKGLISRGLVKRSVMTTVYGVTTYGATNQVNSKLKDLKVPFEFRKEASPYVVKGIFESLGNLFIATRQIQSWLKESASYISKLSGRQIEWITPIGFPVSQPYSSGSDLDPLFYENVQVDTKYMNKPDVVKQKNSYPANFIHSLDACHMMLTSLYCQQAGLHFYSIHDCFLTHACDITEMNKICREQFVALHSCPIMDDLGKFYLKEYGFQDKQVEDDILLKKGKLFDANKHFQTKIEKGSFDINDVKKSEFFFS